MATHDMKEPRETKGAGVEQTRDLVRVGANINSASVSLEEDVETE